MNVQPISWEYQKTGQGVWLGKTNGLLSHIEICITPTCYINDEYQISATIRGFTNEFAIGIDQAKSKAQELLNSYALSLILS